MTRWLVVGIVGFMVAGCDLFTTRDAEEPDTRTDLCGPAVSSDQVMSVMDCALQFHLPESYLDVILQDSFSFEPDGGALFSL